MKAYEQRSITAAHWCRDLPVLPSAGACSARVVLVPHVTHLLALVEPVPQSWETWAESSYFPALVAPLPSRTPTVIATESVA